MKKIPLLMALAALAAAPGIESAEAQTGVYVAPKLMYAPTVLHNPQVRGRDFTNNDVWTNQIGRQTDSSFGGALAFGYDFKSRLGAPIRLELEYAAFSRAEATGTHRYSEIRYAGNKQTYRIQTVFVNAYWDIDTGTALTPYLGLGAGLGLIKTKWSGWFHDGDMDGQIYDNRSSSASRTESNLAWNVGGGLGYEVSEKFTLDLGYRFVGLGSVKTAPQTFTDMLGNELREYSRTDKVYQHQIILSGRYTF